MNNQSTTVVILISGTLKFGAKQPLCLSQRAKKVVSDSPGLVDVAIGLVNSVVNLLNGQVMFFENSISRRTASQNVFGAS